MRTRTIRSAEGPPFMAPHKGAKVGMGRAGQTKGLANTFTGKI